MDVILFLGVIFIFCALSCKTTDKAGMPVLVGFIIIGIVIRNWFTFEDAHMVELLCDFALMMIIFTGGFHTNFKEIKPVLAISTVLSTLGTFLTGALAAAFAYFILKLELYQAMLLGAIISPTDAESVSHVLRSKKMNLKNHLGPMLEAESGSNDPLAHMLTAMLIVFARGGSYNVPVFLAVQILVGVLAGIAIAKFGQELINRINLDIDGLYGVLLCGIAFLAFGAANYFSGNGFLAVYIAGIILGNSKLVYKGFLTRLYSSFSMILQIMLFIVLGILCVPSSIASVVGVGLVFALFLILIVRPVVMFAIMKPFGRPINEIALVSWAGFRGASSIVFSAILLAAGLPYADDIFSIVFFVCMLSVIVQGTSIIPIAKKLKLIDD